MKKRENKSVREGLRRTAVLLCAVLLTLTGCEKKAEDGQTGAAPTTSARDPVTGEYEHMENASSLTGIYRPAEVYRYEGERLNPTTVPLYDAESGELTAFSWFAEDIPVLDENGDPVEDIFGNPMTEHIEKTTIRTLRPDGTCIRAVDLPIPEGQEFHHGGISENGVWYVTYATFTGLGGIREFMLHAMGLDGSDRRSVSAAGVFGGETDDNMLFNLRASVLPDGSMIAAAGNELAVLDRDLNRQYSVAAESAVVALSSAREDGSCLFLADQTPAFKIWRLGAGERQAELFADLTGYIGSVVFGPGADYYLWDSDGIRAMTGEESAPILDRQNSALSMNTFLIGAVAPNVFVLVDTATADESDGITLYRRGDDVDLSSVKVIEVANAMYGTNRDIEEKITKFNREHPDMRVVFTDVLDENVDPDERFDRLCFNLANGFYKPDIIIANNGKKIEDVMIEKHLYRDLAPYLEKDPDVRLDDLFGIVRSYFTDENGGLWGICPTFSLRAPTGRSDVLGKYAEKGSWTLDDALDFLESRPKGSFGIENLTQTTWIPFLLGLAGFSRWIDFDAGECHFDRADFGRLLRYLKTLPKDYDDFMRRADFWAGMDNTERYNDYTPYRNGTIALQNAWFQSVMGVFELEDRFGTYEDGERDLVCIGYPSDDGRDAVQFSTQTVCMITSYCSDPDVAWELIRTFFDDPEGYGGESGDALAILYANDFPAQKSAYDRQAEVFGERYITQVWNPDGYWAVTAQLLPADGSRPKPPANGRAIVFDSDFVGKIRSLLDGIACTPYVNYTPGEIEDIIFEEVSAYLGGGTDADKCVKNIQSRVSIWLAENR